MIKVLRLSHRPGRDKRLTTHVALVARAFGADELVYTGVRDPALEDSIRKVVRKWGGNFKISHSNSWKSIITDFMGKKVHLTMYGVPIDDKMPELRGMDLLVVVGGEKVPPELYKMADFNLSVGNQPHSEAAALAICLDRYFQGKQFKTRKMGLIMKPSERGKIVVKR